MSDFQNREESNHDPQMLGIELVYEDVYRTISFLSSRIDSLNTRLSLVLGFAAAYTRFAADLPGRFIFAKYVATESIICYSCITLKVLTFVFILLSISFAVSGILPVSGKLFLDHLDQINEAEASNKENFQKKVIELLAKGTIPSLEKTLSKKAESAKNSLFAFGISSALSTLDLTLEALLM